MKVYKTLPAVLLLMRTFGATSWRPFRTFATDRKSSLGRTLSLDQFIQRTRVLSFYRHIIRGTRRISDPKTRAETRKFARDEFERHRGVTDPAHIRYLLSTGKTEWDTMERYIDGL